MSRSSGSSVVRGAWLMGMAFSCALPSACGIDGAGEPSSDRTIAAMGSGAGLQESSSRSRADAGDDDWSEEPWYPEEDPAPEEEEPGWPEEQYPEPPADEPGSPASEPQEPVDPGSATSTGGCDDCDEDGLIDRVETKTGIFVDTNDTGTDPAKKDTDGDGFLDGEETIVNPNGPNLAGMGTNPLRRNILIEYDWFDDETSDEWEYVACSGAHSHRPSRAVVDMVYEAFLRAPVTNPDGTRGIFAIQDYGQGGAYTGGTLVESPDGMVHSDTSGGAFKDLRDNNFTAARKGYFHWVLLAHHYADELPDGRINWSSSGNANWPGDSAMVTIGCDPDELKLASTIVHELGHNFGLAHGGNDDVNYKPNYASVMNYAFQWVGIDDNCDRTPDGIIDFSSGKNAVLNEYALQEPVGICNDWWIDWNENQRNDAIDVVADINFDPDDPSLPVEYTELHDFDDWTKVLSQPSVSRAVVPSAAVACRSHPRRQ